MAKENVNIKVDSQETQEADVPFTGGHTEAERMGQPLKGLLISSTIMLVQKKKTFIGDTKSDGSRDYFYNLSFSDMENMFSCTAGKTADDMEVMHTYDVGFDYPNNKLKLVDFILLK